MKNKIILLILSFLSLQIVPLCAMKAPEYGVAIPVSLNPQNNEWSVLLGLHRDNKWWPFSEELQAGEKANGAAQRALNYKTNGVYNIPITGVPWQQLGNIFYHFVPVNFISGTKLYNTATNTAVSDFVWVPAKTLLQQGQIKPHPKKTNIIVGESFVDAFQALWPQMEAQLSASQQPGPATVQITGTKTKPGAVTKISGSQNTLWGGNPNAIYFYKQNEDYYEFTNFWEQDTTIDGKVWPTTEQYYQAMKFTDGNLQETIRKFKSDSSGSAPRKAFNFAKQHAANVRPDWQAISLDTMRKAVTAKFTQHPDLSKLLLATDSKTLVEDAGTNDAFYGAGGDYNGHNWLGKILMEVRGELQKAVQAKVAVQPIPQPIGQPTVLSASPLAQSLNILQKNLNTLEATLSGSQKKIATNGNQPSQAAKRENFNPFAHVVGMPEKDFKTLNATQKLAMVKGNALVNKQTGQPWHMGTVEVASVDALRKSKKGGSGSVFNVIEGYDTPWNNWFREHVDVTALQAASENKDAVFQVASNFNGLEGNGDPDDGIMPYLSPSLYVQGEAAAISAMPGIIYRMYYMPHVVNGTTYYGQLQEQLNLLEQFNTGAYIIPVHNGYIGDVPNIDDFANLSDTELKALAGKVQSAFHSDIQVSGGLGPLKNELPNYIAVKVTDPSQRINQIFAAALNPYGNKVKSKGFKNLAQMLLYAAYESALRSAYAHGKKKVFLTLIGGGVFQNDLSWITQAIEHAVTPFLTYGNLEINLIVYYSGDYKQKDPATWQQFETKMTALTQKSGGQYIQYHATGKQIK